MKSRNLVMAAIIFSIIALVIVLLSVRAFADPTYREQEAKIAADAKVIEKLRADLAAKDEAVKNLQVELGRVKNAAAQLQTQPQKTEIKLPAISPPLEKAAVKKLMKSKPIKSEGEILSEHNKMLALWVLWGLTIAMISVLFVYPGTAIKWYRLSKKGISRWNHESRMMVLSCALTTIGFPVLILIFWGIYFR